MQDNDKTDQVSKTQAVTQKEKWELEKLEIEVSALKRPWGQPSFWFPILIGVVGLTTAMVQFSVSNIRSQRAALEAERTLFESTKSIENLERKLTDQNLELELSTEKKQTVELEKKALEARLKSLNEELQKSSVELKILSEKYEKKQLEFELISDEGDKLANILDEIIDIDLGKAKAESKQLNTQINKVRKILVSWETDNSAILNIEQVDHVSILTAAAKELGVTSRPQVAYILATAFHETSFKFMLEGGPRTEEWRKNNLKYYPYYGRGYVQLTFKEQYQAMQQALDIDLVNDPDKAAEPEMASKILIVGLMKGKFTGRSLDEFISEQKVDFVNARRAVNGLHNANKIAQIAASYLKQIEAGEIPL